jgi:hypothetical protein
MQISLIDTEKRGFSGLFYQLVEYFLYEPELQFTTQ